MHLTNKATSSGINVIVSALTANEDARQLVRETVSGLILGYVNCPIDICAKRDPKGLYAQARKTEIDTLIGFNSEYVPPENPDIIIDTSELLPLQAIDYIVEFLRRTEKISDTAI